MRLIKKIIGLFKNANSLTLADSLASLVLWASRMEAIISRLGEASSLLTPLRTHEKKEECAEKKASKIHGTGLSSSHAREKSLIALKFIYLAIGPVGSSLAIGLTGFLFLGVRVWSVRDAWEWVAIKIPFFGGRWVVAFAVARVKSPRSAESHGQSFLDWS